MYDYEGPIEKILSTVLNSMILTQIQFLKLTMLRFFLCRCFFFQDIDPDRQDGDIDDKEVSQI